MMTSNMFYEINQVIVSANNNALYYEFRVINEHLKLLQKIKICEIILKTN